MSFAPSPVTVNQTPYKSTLTELLGSRELSLKLWLLAIAFVHFAAASSAGAQTDVVGRWSSVPDLPFFPVHAHSLPTGKVMIWPGDEGISGNDHGLGSRHSHC